MSFELKPYLPAQVEELGMFARIASDSGMFGSANEAELIVKLMQGASWGIPPMTALSDVYVVKGKPMASGTLLRAMIRKSGTYDYRVVEHTDQAAEIEFLRVLPSGDREVLGSTRFDIERAQKQGLTSNRLYKTAPRNMLLARATSDGVKTHCPDVFMGSIYTEGELTEEPPIQLPPQRAQPVIEAEVVQPDAAELDAMVATLEGQGFKPVAAGVQGTKEERPDPTTPSAPTATPSPTPAPSPVESSGPVDWAATFPVPEGTDPLRWQKACEWGMNHWENLGVPEKLAAEVKPHEIRGLMDWSKQGKAWIEASK